MKSWDRTRREIPCRAERWFLALLLTKSIRCTARRCGAMLSFPFEIMMKMNMMHSNFSMSSHILRSCILFVYTTHSMYAQNCVSFYDDMGFLHNFLFHGSIPRKGVSILRCWIIWTIIMSSSSTSSARNTITIKVEKWRK